MIVGYNGHDYLVEANVVDFPYALGAACAADLDADGTAEIVTATFNVAVPEYPIFIVRYRGGRYSVQQIYTAAGGMFQIHAGDIDGDGLAEADILCNWSGSLLAEYDVSSYKVVEVPHSGACGFGDVADTDNDSRDEILAAAVSTVQVVSDVRLSLIGRYIATAYAYPEEADKRFGSFNAPRTRISINKRDGTIIYVDVKTLFFRAMKMNGGGLVNANPQNYAHLVKWTLAGNIFQEIEEVVGSQGRPLIPYRSIAIWPTERLAYGDQGYFVVVGTDQTYQFSADDTCPAARGKNQIDVWLGVGSTAYAEAFRWGRKPVDVYK